MLGGDLFNYAASHLENTHESCHEISLVAFACDKAGETTVMGNRSEIGK